MKKTFSINISGIIFNIDNDAYERLNGYLNSIKKHFVNVDGNEEIFTDIESRIAEILQSKLSEDKQVITIDGDGQHRPEDIPALLETAQQNPGHMVIAARLKDNDQAPRARLAANRFADFWISWAAGQWIHDTQSGFRLYPAALIKQLTPDTSKERGFVFESKVLIDAARRGFGCKVTPISSSYHSNARASHFRPVADITRIVLMVSWSLFSRGFFPQGLWRAVRRG